MPIPIFEQQAAGQITEELEIKKEKISSWSFLFSALLIIILIAMGEYAFRDSNAVMNAYYNVCHVPTSFSTVHFMQKIGAPAAACDLLAYEGTKLLLHADIGVPILLLASLFFVFTRRRKLHSTSKVIFFSIYVFAAWMTVRVIYETESFLVQYYPLYGKYVVFLTIAAVCISLIMVIQNKLKKKSA